MSLALVTDKISLHTLKAMYGNFVKAVVDTGREIMVIGADLHGDEEFFLLENGSKQHNLWGINLFPENWNTEGFIAFDSIVNVRPRLGSKTPVVRDLFIQNKIRKIVGKLVYAS
jgi:hypothetical protein